MGGGHLRGGRVRDGNQSPLRSPGQEHRRVGWSGGFTRFSGWWVYGPDRNSEKDGHRRKPFWTWTAYEDDAVDAMQLLATWLSKRRLGRASALTGLRFPVKRLPI
jgi:hypothetical protein